MPEPAVTGSPAPSPAPPLAGGTAPAVVAQLLATEHWSLLATRSTMWSEVMSRLTIHLTVASASLVVLALVAQASGFGTPFTVLAIGLAAAVLVLGTLTQLRVILASTEDASLIIAMNRLRAAYVDLAPEVGPYLVTSTLADREGLMQTYTLGRPRSQPAHIAGSTSLFLGAVNTLVAGTLGALVAYAADAPVALRVAVGAVSGLAYLGVFLAIGQRSFGPGRFPSD
ncbi:MAG: hypothetical protein ABJA89_04100 [Lapillicoccus sp.]